MALSNDEPAPPRDPALKAFCVIAGLLIVAWILIHSGVFDAHAAAAAGEADVRSAISERLPPEERAAIDQAWGSEEGWRIKQSQPFYKITTFNTETGLRLTIVTEGKLHPKPSELITGENIFVVAGDMETIGQQKAVMNVDWLPLEGNQPLTYTMSL